MPEERNDARQLSPVLENYLEIIFHQEIREGAARASSIAEAAGLSRSTVTRTLKALKSAWAMWTMGLQPRPPDRKRGCIGRDIAHRHIVIQEFFQHILQLEPNVSTTWPNELEHVIRRTSYGVWGNSSVPAEPRGRLEKLAGGLQKKSGWSISVQYGPRDLVRNAPPMLAMRTQMMRQDELRKKYR